MKCDWCKWELAPEVDIALLNVSVPISQDDLTSFDFVTGEGLREQSLWPGGWLVALCPPCAGLLNDVLGRLVDLDARAACPYCNSDHLCPTCYAEANVQA